MPQLTFPGVYIEEIPSGVRTTIGVHTGIGAVLGFFANGPTRVPTRVGSWAQFVEIFGDGQMSKIASYTVKQFFDNGGAHLFVIRASGSSSSQAPSIVRSLQALDRVDHFTLLSIPNTAFLSEKTAGPVTCGRRLGWRRDVVRCI